MVEVKSLLVIGNLWKSCFFLLLFFFFFFFVGGGGGVALTINEILKRPLSLPRLKAEIALVVTA